MQSTPFLPPTTILQNGSGVVSWQNPSNIFFADGDFAVSGGPTNVMTVGNFNHNIPQGANIVNINLRVKGYRGNFNTTLDIYAVDNTTGVELSYAYTPPFQGFNGTNTLLVLTPTLFGTTWTVDQINNIKFKLIADGELYLDTMDCSVNYVPATTPVPPTPDTGETVCDEFVQGQRFTVAQSFTESALFFYATSFNYPNGDPIFIGDFYGNALITLDQGVPGLEENARITDIIHDYNGSGLTRIEFTSLTNRGLKFHYPYDADVNLRRAHSGTAEFVISNSAPFYDRFLKKCQIDALVSAPIYVQDEGVTLPDPLHTLDFQGAGVFASNDGTDSNRKIINIPGNGVNPPVVVETSTSTSGGSQVSSLTWDHVSIGLNRELVVEISTEAAQTVSGVTYNGVALTQRTNITNGTLRSTIWTLTAPALGAHAIVVTLSGAAYISTVAETFVSVDQSNPIGATQTATGTSLAPTLSLVTTADNSVVVDSLATGTLPMVYTVGVGQVENGHVTANPSVRQVGSSYELAGTQPDSITMSWAITQNVAWAQTAIELNGVPSAPVVISGVTVEDDSAVVSVPNVVKIVFPDGTVTNPVLGEADVDTTLLKATSADTTPDYLDPKIEIVSGNSTVGVSKTIQNPGANEKISYDLSVIGGSVGGSGGTKIAVGTTPVTVTASTTETTVLSASIPAGTLADNNAIRFKIYVAELDTNASDTLTLRVKYGATTVATAVVNMTVTGTDVKGYIEGYIIADGATNAQVGQVTIDVDKDVSINPVVSTDTELTRIHVSGNGTGAINSTVSQTMLVTVQFSSNNAQNKSTTNWFIAEKITPAGLTGPVNPSTQAFFYDDFLGGPSNASNGDVVGELNWSMVGDGVASRVGGFANHPGVQRITAGVSGNSTEFQLGKNGGGVPTGFGPVNQANITMEFLVYNMSHVTNEMVFGFTEAGNTGNYTADGGKLAFVGKSSVWRGYYVSQSGGSIVTTASTAPTTLNPVKLRIVTDGTGSNAEFFVDGVSLGTVALISGDDMTPTIGIIGSGRNVDTDYFYLNQTLSR